MNILGMGPMEALLIIVIALIVFGPAKLPEIMGQVGKAINDFRRATSDLSEEFNKTIQAELQEGRSALADTKAAVSDVHATVNSAVTGTPAPTRVAVPGEALPAPNGTSGAEGHLETKVNGMLPEPITPPVAEAKPWSWESAVPATPPAESADAASASASSVPQPTTTTEPAPSSTEPTLSSTESTLSSTESAPSGAPADLAKPATTDPSSTRERTPHDDLLPPY